MTKVKYVVLGVCVVLLLSACQPTPESDLIVNKGEAQLDELVLQSAGRSEESSFTNGRILWNESKSVNTEIGPCSVTINMDAETPKVPDKVPVYLIKRGTFGIDFFKKAANFLMEGEIFDRVDTKQDILAEKLDFQKDVETHAILDKYQPQVDEYLESLNQRYNEAPEKNSEAKYEFNKDNYGENVICLKNYMDDNTIATLSATTNQNGECRSFLFRVNEIHRSLYYLSENASDKKRAQGVKTTYEQALELADDMIAELFNESFAMVDYSVIDKTNDNEYFWNDGDATSVGQAYVFAYTREYDGIPSLYIKPAAIFQTENTEFSMPYPREYLQIVVDDRGIIYLYYSSISDTTEKLNDDVKLMPFEEIMDQFKNDVYYHSLWGNTVEITINKVELGMVREPVKDNPDQYMIVPAWNFIGDVESEYVEDYGKSILALSAIDGSIITDYESALDPK